MSEISQSQTDSEKPQGREIKKYGNLSLLEFGGSDKQSVFCVKDNSLLMNEVSKPENIAQIAADLSKKGTLLTPIVTPDGSGGRSIGIVFIVNKSN